MEKKEVDLYFGFQEVKSDNAINWEKSRSEAYKEYRKKWDEIPKTLKIPKFPLHLDIEASNKCNLKCPMCPRTVRITEGKWRAERNFNFSLYKKVLDEGGKKGLCALNLNHSGEPLLHPSLPEMIKYAKDVGILDVFFHTNGTLLTEKMSRKLVTSGLDRMVISFDSPYREKYNRIRIGADYDQVFDNIKKMKDVKKELKSLTPITRINMVKFLDIEKKEIDDAVNLFSKIVDIVGFLDYVDYDLVFSNIGNKIEFPENYISNFICTQPLTRMTLYEDGRVFPCCWDSYELYCIGDVNKNSLENIWTSDKLEFLRKKHSEGKFFEIPMCKNCIYALESDNFSKKIIQSSHGRKKY